MNVLMWSHYADSHKGFCIGLRNVSSETYPALKFDFGEVAGDPATVENGVLVIRQVEYDRTELIVWKPYEVTSLSSWLLTPTKLRSGPMRGNTELFSHSGCTNERYFDLTVAPSKRLPWF